MDSPAIAGTEEHEVLLHRGTAYVEVGRAAGSVFDPATGPVGCVIGDDRTGYAQRTAFGVEDAAAATGIPGGVVAHHLGTEAYPQRTTVVEQSAAALGGRVAEGRIAVDDGAVNGHGTYAIPESTALGKG